MQNSSRNKTASVQKALSALHAPFSAPDPKTDTALPTIIANQEIADVAPGQLFGEIYTEPETASYLKLKIYTLRKWRREGGGPPYIRCGGRLIRYIKADIDDWLNNNTFVSHAAELRACAIK